MSAGFKRVGIVGLGLIGGSVGLAVRRAFPGATVVGVDVVASAVAEALARGAVHEASADLTMLRGSDLVVLAAPVVANLAALEAVSRRVDPGTIVTDVGSTKRGIVQAAGALKGAIHFVGGHPMAGAAEGGIAHADAGLFQDRPWILTPEPAEDERVVRRLSSFVASLGAQPHVMTATGHDRVVAYTSHLTQLVASALMHVVGNAVGEDGLSLAGAGLADTTRLAASPAGIWRDICEANQDNLGPALEQLIDVLHALAARPSDLDALFGSAAAWRSKIRLA